MESMVMSTHKGNINLGEFTYNQNNCNHDIYLTVSPKPPPLSVVIQVEAQGNM